MEYTVSIGDIYETYTGTPEEISKLVTSLEEKKNKDTIINVTNISTEIDINKIKEELNKQSSLRRCRAVRT